MVLHNFFVMFTTFYSVFDIKTSVVFRKCKKKLNTMEISDHTAEMNTIQKKLKLVFNNNSFNTFYVISRW